MPKKKLQNSSLKSQVSKLKRPRQLKKPHYKSFRVSRRIKHSRGRLTGSFRLFVSSIKLLLGRPKLFGGIILVYAVLTIVLVHGLATSLNLPQLKNSLNDLFSGSFSKLGTSIALFSVLISSGGNTSSDVAGPYQSFLLVGVSLALIWTLRQVSASKTVKVRDAFYDGLYPLAPFILVLLVIGLQLVPLIIGNTVFTTVISNGLAVTALEKFLWGLIFFLLAVLSLYMLSSSVFAAYIVTLPNMTPLRALRSSREIVLYRRWGLMRRLVMLFIILLLVGMVIMLPIIWFAAVIAEWAFLVLGLAALAVVHAYIYSLYRELL